MALTTADEPSAVRTTVVTARPSAAKAAAPSRTAKREREPAVGPVGVEDVDAEEELGDHLQRDDDDGRADHGRQVRPGPERRPTHALQEPGLAADDEGDREPGEGGRRDAVAEQPDQEEGRRGSTPSIGSSP